MNKPPGVTSSDVVRKIQHVFEKSTTFSPLVKQTLEAAKHKTGRKARQAAKGKGPLLKIGHGGTLDPLATGVLIIGVGTGTKALSQFLACTKTYETTVLFGVESDSYDVFGRVVSTKGCENVTKENVEKALSQFRGAIKQRPPAFSAKWHNGERLYDLARRGEEIPESVLAAKDMQVDDMKLLDFYDEGTHEFAMRTGEDSDITDSKGKKRDGRKKNKRKRDERSAEQDDQPTKALKGEDSQASKVEGDVKADPVNEPSVDGEEAKTTTEVVSETIDAQTSETTPAVEPVQGGPAARIRMSVSSGFYVRSFCHDLGKALESAGLMATLIRARQADFDVNHNVIEVNDITEAEEEVWAPKVKEALLAWQSKAKKQGTASK